jgi:hypothetical protein
VRGWIEWFAKGLWRRRRPIQVLIGIAFAFTLLVLWQNRNFRPGRTMTDPSFVRAANALCEKKVRPLADKQRSSTQEDKIDDGPKANARRVDAAADKLEAAVTELRALPHRPQNTSQLDAWFGEFDGYIAAGRHYAAALRTGDAAKYNNVDDEGVAPLKAISHFARANRLDSCIP